MAMLKGLKGLYYAKQIKDDETGVAYGTPIKIPGVNKINITRKVNEDTFDADDKIWERAYAQDATEVELIVASLTQAIYADLLGHTVDGAYTKKNVADVSNAPKVAIGFEATKSNGKSKFVWLYNGIFQLPNDENEAASKNVKLKPVTIKASFIGNNYDGETELTLDEDSDNYTAGLKDTFFDNPIPTYDKTAPTCVITPADAATGVAVGANVVFTFDKEIQSSLVNSANFMVMAATGEAVAGALGLDTAGKIVTFNPTDDLSAATAYVAVVGTGVKSLTGVPLASAAVSNFTTA